MYQKRDDSRAYQPAPPAVSPAEDGSSRPFRNRETHPLVRLFENVQSQTDNLLGAPGVSTPLSKSPNILPSPISSLSPVILPMQSSVTTPSPVIDLDSGAITSSQPLRPISPAPVKAMSPGDALHIAPKDSKLKYDTPHAPSEPDNGRPASPLTVKPRKNSGASLIPTTDQLMSSTRLIPGLHSRQLTPSSTPAQPALGHGAKLSPRMASSSPENGLYASKPMSRARSHSDQHQSFEPSNGLLKVEPHHHSRRLHRPAPSVPTVSPQSTEDSGLKPTIAALPLARRVRSATTLRQSEEDTVPLKALVANKQQQLYQASIHANSTGVTEKSSQEIKDKQPHDHRRSISADSTPKVSHPKNPTPMN
ncbi:hypothetical protein BJV82DRAFT_100266 [Fennellomyces sp. T-0311]|nr:hypothetical protein BJV82DRAFT_100266 [Fennellomyces sp. T-0311]